MATLIAFGGVVVNHIQDDFDAIAVQFANGGLEFVHLHADFARCGIARLGREEAHRTVTPVIQEPLTRKRIASVVLELVKLKDGHEFDGVNAEFFQVWDFGANGRVGTGMLHARRGMSCEPAHMHFIDHKVFDWDVGGAVIAPVEVVVADAGTMLVGRFPIRFLSPNVAPTDFAGVGVHQDFGRVEVVAEARLVGAAHPVTVFNFFWIDVKHLHGEDVPNSELRGKGNFDDGVALTAPEQNEIARSGIA